MKPCFARSLAGAVLAHAWACTPAVTRSDAPPSLANDTPAATVSAKPSAPAQLTIDNDAGVVPKTVASSQAGADDDRHGHAEPTAPSAPVTSNDDMILVPAGPFQMGTDRGGQEDEQPEHEVTLPAFWLDRTEVTNAAYEACVTARACRPHDASSAQKNRFGSDAPFRGPEQPISSISWEDARSFCAWSGKRLPREAEWEKAARGTDARKFPWGNEPPDPERAVYAGVRTLPVGSRPKGAGPYGHLDMAGNVWEWLDDVYDPYAYRREGHARGLGGDCAQAVAAQNELRRQGRQGYTGSNPIPVDCERVLRGGAFNYDGPGLRSSNRVHHPPQFRLIMSGVRCAKDGSL